MAMPRQDTPEWVARFMAQLVAQGCHHEWQPTILFDNNGQLSVTMNPITQAATQPAA